jgi:hypothetical protein
MKQIHGFVAIGSMLPFLFLASCRKQIETPVVKEAVSQSLTVATTSCMPSIYGMYNNSSGSWTTIAQKWYSDGKIRNVKLHFFGRPIGPVLNHDEQMLNIDWGELTYEGNQVRLRDVAKNKLIFRVTLDGSGKPVASYLYTEGFFPTETYIDTSYYYYSGNRLNYLIQLFVTQSSNGFVYSPGWEQFTFAYNSAGDLASHTAQNEELTTRFMYSSTPTNGCIYDYPLTTSFKLLEFLELLRMPMSNTLAAFDVTNIHAGYQPYTFYEKRFYNYTLANGLTQSYISPMGSGYLTYYIGWECAGNNPINSAKSQSNIVSSLDQFKELYRTTNK